MSVMLHFSDLFGGEDEDYRPSVQKHQQLPLKSPSSKGWDQFKASQPEHYAYDIELKKQRQDSVIETQQARYLQYCKHTSLFMPASKKRGCIVLLMSVGLSVCRPVCWSVCRSVDQMVYQMIILNTIYHRVFKFHM